MRCRLVFLYTMAAATLLACVAHARSGPQAEIPWHADPVQAHQLARQQERPLLLLLTTSGCHYCTKMKQSTYRDRRVATDITDHFVAARIDAKKHPVLTKKLGVTAFPTTVIISPDYKVVDVIRGYVDARKLRTRMAVAARRVRIANSNPRAGQSVSRH